MFVSWLEIKLLLVQTGSLALLALALNTVVGTTRLLQIGIAGFFALGAYSAGLTTIYTLDPTLGGGNENLAIFLNYLIGIGVAVGVSAVVAVLLGAPILRLRGDYFAIATLAFGEVTRLYLEQTKFPGGRFFVQRNIDGEIVPDEIGASAGIRMPGMSARVFPDHPLFMMYSDYWWLWVWILVAVVYLLLRNLKFSSFGRSFLCIGEDEIAAQSMGINVAMAKMRAFVLSCVLAGLAGAIYMYSAESISPKGFTLFKSIEVLLVVVLGGIGSFSGCILAAIILMVMPQLFNHVDLSNVRYLPEAMRKPLGEYTQIFYAALLIVLIRLAPNGLFGRTEVPAFIWWTIRKFSPSKTKSNDVGGRSS